MPRTGSSSSSPAGDERLLSVLLSELHPHPANPNVMAPAGLAKLARHIGRDGRYPPLVVRPHPSIAGQYQILDGHQRATVLRDAGHQSALCYLWPCDDQTALILLATLNRLQGEDEPARRGELLRELAALLPHEELVLLLPEDGHAIEQALALVDLDPDALLAELTEAHERAAAAGPRLISFAVEPEDEALVEGAIALAMSSLEGTNRRGRALGMISAEFIEARSG